MRYSVPELIQPINAHARLDLGFWPKSKPLGTSIIQFLNFSYMALALVEGSIPIFIESSLE